jgi:predicted NUDIX family NTP pyrophosphohydrolase
MEWPPHTGRQQTFPENDRAQWFSLAEARTKVFAGLLPFLDRLADHLGETIDDIPSQQSLL